MALIDPSAPTTETVYLSPVELAERWRVTQHSLNNLRYKGEGIPYTKTTGRPLYAMHDVLAVESAGQHGFRWSSLSNALGEVLGLPPAEHERLMARLRKVMK
jgi:hypothetical protein